MQNLISCHERRLEIIDGALAIIGAHIAKPDDELAKHALIFYVVTHFATLWAGRSIALRGGASGESVIMTDFTELKANVLRINNGRLEVTAGHDGQVYATSIADMATHFGAIRSIEDAMLATLRASHAAEPGPKDGAS